MECYAHAGITAAAVCRGCGRGVCRRCAIEIPFGVACSTACEAFGRMQVELQQQSFRNIGNLRTARVTQPLAAVILLATGSYLLSSGGYGVVSAMFLAMGGVGLGAWAWTHWRKP